MNILQEQFISFEVAQSPTQENEHLAIVNAVSPNRKDFGTASAQSDATNNREQLIALARERALQNVSSHQCSQNPIQPSPTQTSNFAPQSQPQYPPQAQAYPHYPEDKNKHNGGGNKPASEKQLDMIRGKCSRLRVSPDTVCREVCNRSLNELCGSEADAVIKSLMK